MPTTKSDNTRTTIFRLFVLCMRSIVELVLYWLFYGKLFVLFFMQRRENKSIQYLSLTEER